MSAYVKKLWISMQRYYQRFYFFVIHGHRILQKDRICICHFDWVVLAQRTTRWLGSISAVLFAFFTFCLCIEHVVRLSCGWC